jgi:PIN domain nuclease of toxin-antitoxin system
MSRALRQYLDEVTEFYLSPLSIAEITDKWQSGKLPQVPDPRTWMAHAAENFIMIDLSSAAALQAGLWPWAHGDLVDRSLAAISSQSEITLVHTDKVLRDLPGFPQKWFKNVEA